MAENILILMADELRFDLPGFMGNRVARTPTMDRLAHDAVIFDNAYTPSPVCIPARQCIATGKYPLHTGCEHFGGDLEPGARTFARLFAEAGWLTVACGKLHHRGPDQMQGWLQRIGAECAVNWPETDAAADREQIGRLKWRGPEEFETAGPGISPLALHDRLTVDGAIDFLRMHFAGMYRRAAGSEAPPLLLMVSLQQPHFPFLADSGLFDHYRSCVRPRIHEEPSPHPMLSRGAMRPGSEISIEQVRDATAAYYSLVEKADFEFGRVIDSIEALGQSLDDWTVIVVSDHGDMLGEHCLWEKREFFEGSVRVPMIIRRPGKWGPRRLRENVNTIDLFPTLCDLAGITCPPDLDGRTLVPLVSGRRDDWKNETFSQFGSAEFMIKRGNLKYLTFGNDTPDVLFDLASDPGETANQISNHAYATEAATLRDRLQALIESRGDSLLT